MRIYVHGNCQAPALADLIAEACGSAVEITARQVYSIDLEHEGAAYREDVALADVILTQPVADGYRGTDVLSTSWVRANARSDAQILVFPVVYHRGQIPQCFTLADFHDGRLAYHDAHALDHFLRGESWETFLTNSSRSNFLPEAFVQSELAATTLELLRRERAGDVDINVSDIIASRLLTEQPLHTVNHPSRPVLADMANRVLGRLGRGERARPDGIDMLDRFIMPPYLSAAIGIGHTGRGVWLDDVRVEGVIKKRPEFFRTVFEEYAEIGAPALTSAINANSELTAYLSRYRAAVTQSTEPELGDFAGALYQVFFGREASSDEKLHHLKTLRQDGFAAVVSSFPRSSEFLASGGGAALQARFDLSDTMPVAEPNIRIPHPVTAAPPSKRPSLKSRMRAAYRVLVGRSDPDPTAVFESITVEDPLPALADQQMEATSQEMVHTDLLGAAELDVDPFEGPGSATPANGTKAEAELPSLDVIQSDQAPPSRSLLDDSEASGDAGSMVLISDAEPGASESPYEPISTEADTMAATEILNLADPSILTIVVPMAGRGSRFASVGYFDPKPLIPVHGQPMIKVVIDNLTPSRPHRFVFICQREHASAYGLIDRLRDWAPGSVVVEIDGVTDGAACTVLTAREHLGSGPLMIANSDQFVEVAIDDYLAATDRGLDGLIMTMRADDPKWSYAAIREDGLVSRVVEKQVISDQATVGIYNFASASDFVASADRMIAADERVNGEFYVAPVYNDLIAQGRSVGVFNVGEVGAGMYGLGTPEDLQVFLARSTTNGEAA